ncbi:MAG: ABC transporter ATP-binding protein [Candidatus Kariarchaeaceae archaeon]|jgi:putative ABC transport system ATP-binding protein
MIKAMLKLTKVNKKFNEGSDTEIHAVRDADLIIEEGEMVALMGPSGSGKTTLLNLIGGLTPITEGTIEVDSEDVGELSDENRTALRRDKIGFIFQHFNLLEFLTAEQNVMLPLLIQGIHEDVARRRSTMMLRELGLGGRLEHYPNELSGGQEQRVAIARSLITNPRIMLGDEPTGDLDESSSYDVLKIFRRINKERKQTLLLVTHNPKIGEFCDRIIRIDDGSIISTGKEDK